MAFCHDKRKVTKIPRKVSAEAVQLGQAWECGDGAGGFYGAE